MSIRNIAIVGAGPMAGEHARAFAGLPSVRIAGIQSRTRARAEALAVAYGAEVFDDIEAMWTATKADVVIVAVPPLQAREVCSACFQYPWTCLIEKPLGYNLQDALDIEKSAEEAGVRAFVAFNRRSYAATRQVHRELAQISGPRLITVLDQQDMDSVRAHGHPESVAQNWMYANSIHLIDYFTHFGRGPIAEVDVAVAWDQAKPGTVIATLTYESGDIGLYQAVWKGPAPWQVTVGTEVARFELRPLERLSIQHKGQRQSVQQNTDPKDLEYKPGIFQQAAETLRFLETGKCALATLAESTRTMRLVAAIYGLETPPEHL